MAIEKLTDDERPTMYSPDDKDGYECLVRRKALRIIDAQAAEIERLLEALRKIDAVSVDSAHFIHSGMQHAAVGQVDDALESVRDLIGPAPEPPAQPVPPDRRTDEEKARCEAVRDVTSWNDLKGKKL